MEFYRIYDIRKNELLVEGKGDQFDARDDLELLHRLANIPYKYMKVLWLKGIN